MKAPLPASHKNPIGARQHGAELHDIDWLYSLLEQPDWHDQAACTGRSDLMVGPELETWDHRTVRVATAKRLCARCPVISECLEAAIKAPDEDAPGVVRAGLLPGAVTKERRARARQLAA